MDYVYKTDKIIWRGMAMLAWDRLIRCRAA